MVENQQAREELRQRLTFAARCFEAAAAGDRPLVLATLGIQNLGSAAALTPDLHQLDAEAAGRVSAAIPHVAAVVAPLVAKSICAERVYLGFGAALALITVGEDGLRADRVLHAGALAAEMNLFTCRQKLAERGDPLSRAMSIRRAMEALPLPGAPLQ